MGMVLNDDGSLDSTNFTGQFRIATAVTGVAVNSSTWKVSITTANDAANKLATTAAQTFNVPVDSNLDTVYNETVNLTVADASGEFATNDGLVIQSPSTEVISRANSTNLSISTNTASGVPDRQIKGQPSCQERLIQPHLVLTMTQVS